MLDGLMRLLLFAELVRADDVAAVEVLGGDELL
jgi:hypothetical protein